MILMAFYTKLILALMGKRQNCCVTKEKSTYCFNYFEYTYVEIKAKDWINHFFLI